MEKGNNSSVTGEYEASVGYPVTAERVRVCPIAVVVVLVLV
jgi:hypothetical protein